MKKRCEPRIVQDTYQKTRSWRKTAESLNALYGVDLSFLTWRDYATGRRDITDPETRARLLLGPRVCPGCGRKHTARRSAKPRRIREYGYPTVEVKSFDEVLRLREAMR
jgi:hypothetical protein